ncbi:FdhF/YdeP family oxidoreductase [Limoniibacter endophyticus]|uniref:Oxidoreductase alpha (Molybdopterin) subunit n=1 Tax=Limoniibacter endophyticus TaxID=1565040 RepID=A0A8J3DNZ2_9HYPH|nr:FdhF/YdeP family oxidoreductase [Limoniibacter endophyticus]GHC72472.1 oxidoreductase alpha (molybdopterin) subunit [Limoniibacter endophyticus]
MTEKEKIEPYDGPAGGWGSLNSVRRHALEANAVSAVPTLLKQNKPDGFACVSCAWAKPAHPRPAEFCENGAKATFWELTGDRATPTFFAQHTIQELRSWSDHALEKSGRLTHPMRYNSLTDHYEAVDWETAFAEIGSELALIRQNDPKRAIFYTSGRASLETSYMYALFARLYGNNNLPDSSNMCHESTSVGLLDSIGVPVGTVTLDHFEKADALFFFGQNVGSNSPRMLHQLKEASDRGAAIVTFNPLRERGLERFTDPQNPVQMLTGGETIISRAYYQLRPGGDIAAISGMCKWLLDQDRQGKPTLDQAFINEHCHGFEEFVRFLDDLAWTEIEQESGLSKTQIEEAAAIYANARRVIAIYGMGITQHKLGVQSVHMLVNFLLMRGNIGREGAGICPVRGHSNVQGQRTVGISEKPELVPLDKLADQFDFAPPREQGTTTIEACERIIDGEVDAFVGLGGNFLRAVPERELMEANWPRMRLSVQIATKLNRGHLFTGEVGYLLPCLGRIEIDRQASGPQVVTIEDSTSMIHVSKPMREPASEHLLSEPKIVAEIAKACLPPNQSVPWDDWIADYGRIRDAIAQTYPAIFHDFNQRMHQPGGFRKPIAADERKWNTQSGKANFLIPSALHASFDDGRDPNIFRLITLRSNDQFNTTVYGYRDRFRGIEGTRMVVFLNGEDMARLGIAEGELIGMESAADDGVERRMRGFRATRYNIPRGSCGAYYPEANALIPLWQHAERSQVPAAKSVPVRLLLRNGATA